MKVTRREHHYLFEIERAKSEHSAWSLWVFDDLWRSAGEDPYDDEFWSIRMLGDPEVTKNRRALAALPRFCEQIPEIDSVIVSDFVVHADTRAEVDPVLRSKLQKGPAACLFDLRDRRHFGPGSLTATRKFVAEMGIPPCRCATFTDQPTVDDLPKLDKNRLLDQFARPLEDCGPLMSWWKLMRGEVCYLEIFGRETTSSDGTPNPWHNASNLERNLTDDRFEGFLGRMCEADSYGVWRWVRDTLKSGRFSMQEKMYAFTCGKYFLRSADPLESGELASFPFTALRGLVMGFCHNIGGQRQPGVADDPSELPGLEPKAHPPIDDGGCFGLCHPGRLGFPRFARRLRDWLLTMHVEPGGVFELENVTLARFQPACQLRLEFAASLPAGIFGMQRAGTLSKTWRDLAECFLDDYRPTLPSESEPRVVKLNFRLDPKKVRTVYATTK